MTRPRIAEGRGWAYIGAGLGGLVSIAANVAHSYVPPVAAAPRWSPPPGAVVGAVFWPVALFVAVEIMARVAWPAGRGWTLLRFGGLAPVAAVAALVSYRHLSGLLRWYGEDPLTVTLGPLAVDGLMVMATGALMATVATRRVRPVAGQVAAEDADDLDDVEDEGDDELVRDPWDYAVPIGPMPAPETAMPENPTPEPAVSDTAATPAPRKRPPSYRDRVVAAHRRTPAATDAQLAARLKVSVKTIERHRPPKVSDTYANEPSINGHTPELVDAP